MKPNTTFLLIAGMLATLPAHGAVLAQYNFNADSAASTHAADPLFTSTNFVKGAFTGGTAADAFIGTNMARVRGSATPSSNLTDSITTGSYFGFTLDLAPTATVNLSSMTFDEQFLTLDAAAGSRGFSLLYSIDGFATSTNLFTETAANLNGEASFTSRNVDLSGVAFQGITQDAQFRFYFYDSSTSTARVHQIDNVVLNGTVTAVPETSAALLGGLGMLVLLGRRRRL